MKGIVFCEFLEMVESEDGFDMVDRIIEKSEVPNGGSYTSVGTYDHGELVSLLIAYSELKDQSVDVLLRAFGTYLFRRFVVLYPAFFDDMSSAFDFLSHIESYIHVEVRKLYPDAELPTFSHRLIDENRLELIYTSSKHLPDFAEGLMQGCIEHFGESIELNREAIEVGGVLSERFELIRTREPGHDGD
jgi:hypothetical protein